MDKKVLGISSTAFFRVIPGFFFKNYGVICHQKTREDAQLKDFFNIFYLAKKKKKIVSFLTKFDTQGWLISYKPTEWLEEICRESGWQMMANKTSLREFFENKKNFREMLKKIGIKPIEGDSLFIKDFKWNGVQKFQKKYGERIVLQLPEVKFGGGTGTFFVKTKTGFERFLKKAEEKKELRFVNVLRFIKGTPACTYGCVTPRGILTSSLFAVAIDVKESLWGGKKDGVYCGNDWSFFNDSPQLNKKAGSLTEKIGRYLAGKNYKGIFSLDFIADAEKSSLYLNECNPRYGGSFPAVSLFQMAKGITPMDIYHFNSFLSSDFEFDFKKANKDLKTKIVGSQIFLRNRESIKMRLCGVLNPGVYRFKNGSIKLVNKGFFAHDLSKVPFWRQEQKDIHFLPIAIPKRQTVVKKGSLMGRLIFPTGCLDKERKLKDEYRQIVNLVYEKLDLR